MCEQNLKCPMCARYAYNECGDRTALECLTSENDRNFVPAENAGERE